MRQSRCCQRSRAGPTAVVPATQHSSSLRGTGWGSPLPAPQEWAAGSPACMPCWEGQVPTTCLLPDELPSCERLEEDVLSCLCL